MRALLTGIFTLIAVVLLTLGVKTSLEFNNALTNNYLYADSEKGQIIAIDVSKFQFIKNVSENTYTIRTKELSQIKLDGTKYDLSNFFSSWKSQTSDNEQTLDHPANCNYVNFVLQSQKGKSFEDNLEYLYCSKNIEPTFSSI